MKKEGKTKRRTVDDAKRRIAPMVLDAVENLATEVGTNLKRIEQEGESQEGERDYWLEKGRTCLSVLDQFEPYLL